MAAGTPFHVLGDRGEHVAVAFPEGWLDPAEGAELLLPAAAAKCPAEAYTREPPSLEGMVAPE